ncbi:MAG: hypothetical protein HYU02_00995 [Thaumarchaeota archaeon]|nr:hypothetical protein [Nitrososphaerota archaeon]
MVQSYNEARYGERFEGDKVKVADLVGKEVIFHTIKELKSNSAYGDGTYFLCQIEVEGKKAILSVGGVLKKQLSEVRDKLPIKGTIKKQKNYYKIA